MAEHQSRHCGASESAQLLALDASSLDLPLMACVGASATTRSSVVTRGVGIVASFTAVAAGCGGHSLWTKKFDGRLRSGVELRAKFAIPEAAESGLGERARG